MEKIIIKTTTAMTVMHFYTPSKKHIHNNWAFQQTLSGLKINFFSQAPAGD